MSLHAQIGKLPSAVRAWTSEAKVQPRVCVCVCVSPRSLSASAWLSFSIHSFMTNAVTDAVTDAWECRPLTIPSTYIQLISST